YVFIRYHAPRVILFGAIPAIIPEVPIVPADLLVAPNVGTVSVVSHDGVLDLVDYSSSSDSDPSEDSLPLVPDLPLVSPFLCSVDSKADGESEPAEQRPDRHESLTPSFEFPLAPVVAPPRIRRRLAILVRAGEAIPFGQPYRTHLNGPRSPSDHSLSGHTPPDTTDADTSTPPRFVHRSLARTLRRHWIHPHLLLDRLARDVDTADADVVADVGISDGVVAHIEDDVGMGVEIAASDVREDDEEFKAEASAANTRKIVVDPLAIVIVLSLLEEIETTQRQLETSQLVASRERASLVERIRSLRLEYLKARRDRDDTRRRLKRLESGKGNGGNVNPNENGRGDRPIARECTYQYFMKCQPLNFKGTKGVVGLIRTIGAEAAFAMSWRELMKLMAEVYCPRNEIQKMESELWNLTVKNNDLAAYTQRFQELTMICTKMVPEEEDRAEKFIGELLDNIQGNVIATEPIKLQDTVRIADNLMDQKWKGYAVKNAENKRRLEVNQRDNRGQQL
ncbi:reverse transcriptase domain-containing protein, partial [Tanacetum coccineum]